MLPASEVSMEVAAFTKLLQANRECPLLGRIGSFPVNTSMGTPKRPASLSLPAKMTKTSGSGRPGARRCGFPECGKTAKPGGFCISHGGGKKCSVEGCTTSVVSRGFCVAHGGGKRCQHPDCSKSAQTGGFCWIHGGGKKCGFEGCTKRAQSGGACISHGGGKRCRIDGCNKVVQYEGLCVSHGGYRRCLSINCSRKALANSYCQLHGGNSHCTVANCRKKAVRGGTCGAHKLMASLSAQQQHLQQLQQSSDEEEASRTPVLVSVSTPVITSHRKPNHHSPPTPLMVQQQKTIELRAAADAFIAAAEVVTRRPSISTTSPSRSFSGSPGPQGLAHTISSVVPPLHHPVPTTISPTMSLQGRFSQIARVTSPLAFTPPPTSDSVVSAAVSLSQLKPNSLPGIASLQRGIRDARYSSPSREPSWTGSSPFHYAPQSLSPPSLGLIPGGSVGQHRCIVNDCGRFAKRDGLCLLHGSQ